MTKRELGNFIDNIKRVERIDIDIVIDEDELELYEHLNTITIRLLRIMN